MKAHLVVPTFWFLARLVFASESGPRAFGPFPTMRMCQQAQDSIDVLKASTAQPCEHGCVPELQQELLYNIIAPCTKVTGWK